MKRIAIFVFAVVLYGSTLLAMDQNVAIDDALSRVYSAALKIKNAKVISMVPFEYGPGVTFKSVEDKIVLKLARTGAFKVMDKKSLEAIINEQKLSISGLTEQTNIAKIGQLLNADALLFGRVYLSGEAIVISVNLKDVATGAIIWADEFVGEDLNKVDFGPGIRSGFFNGNVKYLLNEATLKETLDGGSAENQFFFAFTFSFEQKLQALKAVSFSLDGIFYRGFFQPDPVDVYTTKLVNTYEFIAHCNYTNLKLQLCALVRLHLGYIFDMNNDIVVIYFGPGLDANYMLADATYSLTNTTTKVTQSFSYKKNIGEILAFGGMTFRVGVELKLSTNFSVFMEAFYIPEITASMIDVDTKILPKVTIGQGNSTYGLGIKYVVF